MATVYEIFAQCWAEKKGRPIYSANFAFEMLYWDWVYGIYVGE